MVVLGVSKIRTYFQISIPPEVRKRLNLKKGGFIAFVEEDGKIYLSPVTG